MCRELEGLADTSIVSTPPIAATHVAESDCRAVTALASLRRQLGGNHMSETYVPTISSGTAGPLGVLHLPRLWLKVSLESAGKLAPGYPGIGRGFDAMT